MTPRYRLTGVTKYYGDKIALELESLTILPGASTSLPETMDQGRAPC